MSPRFCFKIVSQQPLSLPDGSAETLAAGALEAVDTLQERVARCRGRVTRKVIDKELITVTNIRQCGDDDCVVHEADLCVGRAVVIDERTQWIDAARVTTGGFVLERLVHHAVLLHNAQHAQVPLEREVLRYMVMRLSSDTS